MSGVYVNVNRGKRAIVLDLQTEAGKTALQALIRTADVFIHSMRSKAVAKLGFGYDDVAEINPGIVYTNCYGYGRRGPDRDRPAYDDTIQAECGLPAVQQQLTGEANYVGTIIADKVAGLTALYATMMALFHRERTGEGQEVEVSMFETMASFMLVEHANGAMFDPPLGPAVYPRTVAPNRRPYRTSDGYIAALIYNDKHWNAFVNAVRPVWANESYATLEMRANDIDTVYGLLAETLQERTTDEWMALFRELEIPAAPLNTPDALFDHPHLNAVGLFETVQTPYGPVRMPGVPTWFSKTPGRIAGPTRELGADTAEVLSELGLDRDTCGL
jgi:crotonobetainyl-CoA:carnitine CoA-transferase CaiB-like acyl-CoA transferase